MVKATEGNHDAEGPLGSYRAPLPPGEYRVKVSAAGFQGLTEQHVIVEALGTVPLDLKLQIGSASEQVTVESTATMLHTDDATLGGSMQNNVYQTLPLAMNGMPRAFAAAGIALQEQPFLKET